MKERLMKLLCGHVTTVVICLLGIIVIVASVLFKSVFHLHDDNLLEETGESLVHTATGWDLELSP